MRLPLASSQIWIFSWSVWNFVLMQGRKPKEYFVYFEAFLTQQQGKRTTDRKNY